jgi:LuxR family maltose regulon positive regulatory protein
MHDFSIGDLEHSLARLEEARSMPLAGAGAESWGVSGEALAMYSYTYLGEFTQARDLVDAVTAAQVTPPPAREVLCPGVLSQVALAEGELAESDLLATGALESARQFGFERHYFAFTALRTSALLALERRELGQAAAIIEETLGLLNGGRPIFDYLAQLDRARIWAASGNVEDALTSLPDARSALRNDHSVLLGDADELEARFRLALGDHGGALLIADRLPADRRSIVTAIIALGGGDDRRAAAVLDDRPARGSTTRTDLELRLLRATVAFRQQSPGAIQLVREALTIIERHGFVQTVLDTSPQLVEHLISEEVDYPATDQLRALITAGLDARHHPDTRPEGADLPDPLTAAEIRVLHTLPQRLTYLEMASTLHLSLNTVKTHLRHTYMKLGVTSRSAAVQRATALGLL